MIGIPKTSWNLTWICFIAQDPYKPTVWFPQIRHRDCSPGKARESNDHQRRSLVCCCFREPHQQLLGYSFSRVPFIGRWQVDNQKTYVVFTMCIYCEPRTFLDASGKWTLRLAFPRQNILVVTGIRVGEAPLHPSKFIWCVGVFLSKEQRKPTWWNT